VGTTETSPISVRHATKRYGSVLAVDDLTFDVGAGSITGFLGPNGAGKTTTLRMVGGLLHPSSGAALLFGVDARRPPAREVLGYMPADPVFLPHLSGRANLDLLARLRGAGVVPDRAAAAATLELSEGDLDRRVRGYSSGMRQKLAIVAALQHRPEVIVLDEPANRLDPLAHHAFCGLLRAAAARGATVLLSTHVLAEVEAVCDSVLLVREGRLLTAARVADLRDHSARTVTLVYDGTAPCPPELRDASHPDAHSVVGRVPSGHPELIRRLVDDPAVVDVTIAPVSLEDVVLDLYSGRSR
jgi:ABC-2 type transport system ATP-binding protein